MCATARRAAAGSTAPAALTRAESRRSDVVRSVGLIAESRPSPLLYGYRAHRYARTDRHAARPLSKALGLVRHVRTDAVGQAVWSGCPETVRGRGAPRAGQQEPRRLHVLVAVRRVAAAGPHDGAASGSSARAETAALPRRARVLDRKLTPDAKTRVAVDPAAQPARRRHASRSRQVVVADHPTCSWRRARARAASGCSRSSRGSRSDGGRRGPGVRSGAGASPCGRATHLCCDEDRHVRRLDGECREPIS